MMLAQVSDEIEEIDKETITLAQVREYCGHDAFVTIRSKLGI